jgi:hypothetical protein
MNLPYDLVLSLSTLELTLNILSYSLTGRIFPGISIVSSVSFCLVWEILYPPSKEELKTISDKVIKIEKNYRSKSK